jgi:recombination associated protein RdgC
MSTIKSARVYVAHLPSAAAMEQHLAAHLFAPIGATQTQTAGFVPFGDIDHGPLVISYPSGYACSVKVERKNVPGHILDARVERAASVILEKNGRKAGKKERAEMKEAAFLDLVVHAFPSSAVVTLFFHTDSKTLFVNTTSQALCNIALSALVQAVDSVKTETVNVSSVKHGLTQRMHQWLDDGKVATGNAFGPFDLVDRVSMADDEKSRVTIRMSDIEAARESIRECLSRGLAVTSVRLERGGTQFNLLKDFSFSGIEIEPEYADETETTPEADAEHQVSALANVMALLLDMFKYEAPPEAAASDHEKTQP